MKFVEQTAATMKPMLIMHAKNVKECRKNFRLSMLFANKELKSLECKLML